MIGPAVHWGRHTGDDPIVPFFSPPKRAPIIQETVAKSRNFPWAEATAVLSFLAGVLELAKALVAIVW
jgi:hypothetical protein